MNINHGKETQRKDVITVTFRKGTKKVKSFPRQFYVKQAWLHFPISTSFRKEMAEL